MTLPPLTHHEIVQLVDAFTRRGLHLDLRASDRAGRLLRFQPIEHAAEAEGESGFREQLRLDCRFRGVFELVRELSPPRGPSATLTAEGEDPELLLQIIERVPPRAQLRVRAGRTLCWNHRVLVGAPAGVTFTDGIAELHGLRLTLRLPPRGSYPADVEVSVPAGDPIAIPEDLLSVIDWRFGPLRRSEESRWVGRAQVGGRGGAERSRRAERLLERASSHLAATLSGSPRAFHERFVAARFLAAGRRLLPLLAMVLAVVLALLIPTGAIHARPVLFSLLGVAALVLVGLSFALSAEARMELPAWPRPPRAPAWRPLTDP